MTDSSGDSPDRVLVTGAGGFIGRHAAAALRRRGVPVRGLILPAQDPGPLEALECELVTGDVARPETLAPAFDGCTRCLHAVEIVRERPREGRTFERVHVEGARAVASAAAAAGIKRLVLVSALGAAADAPSRFLRSKYQGEQILRESGLDVVILRPSVVYGPGDEFAGRLVRLIETFPLLVPVVGQGWYRIQPLAVADFTECAVRTLLEDEIAAKTYELGGPEAVALLDLLDLLMAIRGRSRIKLHVFIWLLYLILPLWERLCSNPLITLDEMRRLRHEAICAADENGRVQNDAHWLVRGRLTDLESGLRAFLSPGSDAIERDHLLPA